MRRYLLVLFIMIMIPYLTTLAWTGKVEIAGGDVQNKNSGAFFEDLQGNAKTIPAARSVIVGYDEKEVTVSVEDYLIHVLAAQIPAAFESETLKAQAILARTYIYGLMEGRKEIYEEELDMDVKSNEEMKAMWGETDYPVMLSKIRAAIAETAGLYLIYEGKLIEPLFCYASAGRTRTYGDAFPYLKQVESEWDLQAENYRSLPMFEIKEFISRINEIPGAVEVSEKELKNGGGIQIVERDSSGYVKLVQIGQKTYFGEEVQYALGLASPCYSFEYLEDKIRVICKGIGHGYGFAQYGANEMAKEGKMSDTLLTYYFRDVEIVQAE